MKKQMVLACAALAALALIGPTPARADGYKVQEDTPVSAASGHVQMDGIVNQVDVERERVTLTGDDGQKYTLDTSGADVTLRDGAGTRRDGRSRPRDAPPCGRQATLR